jgi:hypothetical protein
MKSFIHNPYQTVNTECTQKMPLIDWVTKTPRSIEISKQFFGVENSWEGL